MKKQMFLFPLFMVSSSLFAQHSLESRLNMYRADDEIIKQQVEYKDPGRGGENVLWDFSRLTSVNDEYRLSFFEAYNGKLAGMEHQTMYYYTLSNDSLLLWGFENATTKLKNDQPELLLKYPVKYQDHTSCYYHGHGLYCDRLEMDAMGTVETQADAYGMMILPSRDTLKNVIRTRTVKYIAEELKPISDDYYFTLDSVKPMITQDSIDYRLAADSTLIAVETFRWYSKGYRYPVFETVRSWTENTDGTEAPYFGTAFFFPPQAHYYLEEDAENLAVLEEEGDEKNEKNEGNVNLWEGLTYNFYPNPVITNLDIEVFMPRTGHVKMQLVSRMGLTVWSEDFGVWPAGVHAAPVFMSAFPVGDYVLNMWFDDYLVGEKIVKR